MENQKVFLLIGITGSGKSTTGNILINKNGDMRLIRNSPFETSDSATGCTKKFNYTGNSQVVVLDTVGFGDPQFTDQNKALDEFKEALKYVNNKIDCVLFVVKKGRFTNEIVCFFKAVQEKVLMGKCKNNSVLVVTDCEKGWIDAQVDSNSHVRKAYENCGSKCFELSLKFDRKDDDEEDKEKNVKKRKKAIDEFNAYLDGLSFTKIDLSEVQTAAYEKQWYEHILPILTDILITMVGGPIGPIAVKVKDKCLTM